MDLERLKTVFVDGFKIRNTLDDDFGVLHKHSTHIPDYMPKFYIPEGEMWVDYRHKDELDFLMKVDEYVLPEEMPHHEYRASIAGELTEKGPVPEYRIKEELKDDLTIVTVDGSVVRRYLDPEFILGGHDIVYSYIPKGEIWLDMKIASEEVKYILYHEEVERTMMEKGVSYDVAHEHATAADKDMRRKDGAAYPGDANYPWHHMTNKEIIEKFYVI